MLLFGLLVLASPSWATDFTVDSTNDPGNGTCDAGECTLRGAINAANATAAADTVKFNVTGDGVKTIAPTSQLPEIAQPVTIDGYTQSGAKVNTLETGQRRGP